MSQPRLLTVPLTTASANVVVANIHRHHGVCPPALVHAAIGCVAEGRLCGAAIVGRPANRNSDDGQTAEVLRVATDGTPNACSHLYGASAQIARRMGFAKILTYTLDVEGGVSLRAAGWKREAEGIESWWHRYPEKNQADRRTVVAREHHGMTKVRWAVDLREPLEVDMALARPVVVAQAEALFP